MITEFAISLKHLKQDEWHNSIDELPEGKTLPQENMLLLWKLDKGFTDAFCTHQRTTPKRGITPSPGSKDGTTPRSNVRLRLASKAPVADLSKAFEI